MNDLNQNVTTQEPRSSWGLMLQNIIQGLVVIVLTWVANNLYQVNLTLAANSRDKIALEKEVDRLSSQLTRNDVRDDVQEQRLNSVENRVSVIDGRNQRGGQEGQRRER